MHKKSLLFCFSFSIACVVIALISQYQFNMQPCPWCILQRLIFIVIAFSCLAFYFIDKKILSVIGITLLSVLGQITAVYQYVFASQSTSCKLSMAEKIISNSRLDQLIPYVFEIKTSCADGAVKVLGLNYEIYSFLAFSLISASLIIINFKKN